MPSVLVRDAHPDDAKAVCLDARPGDRREWEGATGTTLEVGLRVAIRWPKAYTRTALVTLDGQVLACWGCQPLGDGRGQLWFAGREIAYKFTHGIHQHWRSEIDAMHALFPTELLAWSGEWQDDHHQWLLRLGFRPDRAGTVIGSEQFHLFTRTKR
jgi:hypothetical protein